MLIDDADNTAELGARLDRVTGNSYHLSNSRSEQRRLDIKGNDYDVAKRSESASRTL